jgi:hypothetical protein
MDPIQYRGRLEVVQAMEGHSKLLLVVMEKSRVRDCDERLDRLLGAQAEHVKNGPRAWAAPVHVRLQLGLGGRK